MPEPQNVNITTRIDRINALLHNVPEGAVNELAASAIYLDVYEHPNFEGGWKRFIADYIVANDLSQHSFDNGRVIENRIGSIRVGPACNCILFKERNGDPDGFETNLLCLYENEAIRNLHDYGMGDNISSLWGSRGHFPTTPSTHEPRFFFFKYANYREDNYVIVGGAGAIGDLSTSSLTFQDGTPVYNNTSSIWVTGRFYVRVFDRTHFAGRHLSLFPNHGVIDLRQNNFDNCIKSIQIRDTPFNGQP